MRRTCYDVYLRNKFGEAAAQPKAVHFSIFSTFLQIFRSLIKVRSQNKDDPTANEIRHDTSQNQRSELLTFLSILKTSLLIDLFVLYSILKNDIHAGKWEQGILPQRLKPVLSLGIPCLC